LRENAKPAVVYYLVQLYDRNTTVLTMLRSDDPNYAALQGFFSKSDKSKPILVTGIDGFVAGVLVKYLLDAGFVIHGTWWTHKPDHWNDMHGMKLFRANLLDQHAFDEPMKGCSLVFHSASPFVVRHGVDTRKDLVEPALHGTRNVLEAASRTNTVRRIVLTSSLGACYGDATDTKHKPASEATWNTTSNLHHQGYFYSKTIAEKEAWRIHDSQSQWSLVTVQPALILGPAVEATSKGQLFPQFTSQSFRMIHEILQAHPKYWTGVPAVAMPVVDVRDAVAAHLLVGLDASHEGRHVLAAHSLQWVEVAARLRRLFPQLYIIGFRSFVPKLVMWLVADFAMQGVDRKTIWENVNERVDIDTIKSQKVLRLRYRPLDSTLRDMAQQILSTGHVVDHRKVAGALACVCVVAANIVLYMSN